MTNIDFEFKNVISYSRNIAELKRIKKDLKEPTTIFYMHTMITNLIFGKTYYMYYGSKLIAFKIQAFSFINNEYLVQTPNGYEWLYLSRVFNTKEEYFLYLEGKCKPIKLNTETPHNFDSFKYINKWTTNQYELKNSFKWSYKGKPEAEKSYVYDVLYTENGFIIYYDIKERSYPSYEECLKYNVDGMEIIDFEEEIIPTITITFKTESKPKIHTLRFIEE